MSGNSKVGLCLALAAALFRGLAVAREITDLRQAAPTYQVFETTAGHADLADCETDLAQDREEVFYRLTLAAERAHLFMASYDRAQRLVTVASYELSSLGGLPL